MNLNNLIEIEISNGYDDTNAQAKVCQDIILKAIAESSLARNITVKGGVVMRSKSNNIRRATQDIDMDFIKYSLADPSIDVFLGKINCLEGIEIKRYGEIEELKQQDYHGKRVFIQIVDSFGNIIRSKLDLGVHAHLEIDQEEYCFDVAFDDVGASVLINTNEQMFTEKLRSLLRLGPISTRYKDIYDMYFLTSRVDIDRLRTCLQICIIQDELMRENSIDDIINRVNLTFSNRTYLQRISNPKIKWMDDDVETVVNGIRELLMKLK